MKTDEMRRVIGDIDAVRDVLKKIEKYLPTMRMSVTINGYDLNNCLTEGDSAAIAAIVRTRWQSQLEMLEAKLRVAMQTAWEQEADPASGPAIG